MLQGGGVNVGFWAPKGMASLDLANLSNCDGMQGEGRTRRGGEKLVGWSLWTCSMLLPGFNMEYPEFYNIYFSWVEMIYKQFSNQLQQLWWCYSSCSSSFVLVCSLGVRF